MRDRHVAAANALAHAHERRYTEPVTPGDHWRGWTWPERFVMVAAGLTLAAGGWLIVVAALVIGSPA